MSRYSLWNVMTPEQRLMVKEAKGNSNQPLPMLDQPESESQRRARRERQDAEQAERVNRPPSLKLTVKGHRLDVAKMAAKRGIPFSFITERGRGRNTVSVGFVPLTVTDRVKEWAQEELSEVVSFGGPE